MHIGLELRTVGLIALAAICVFVPFLGAIPLFDWDEVNFAEVTREMILIGDYSRAYIDFVPFWEKPPFFFWLQALSMQVWGVGEFAARFPNAICGVVTLCGLYLIGRKWYSHRFGVLWAVAYGCSLLPHLYFRSGIIDPWFNLFIFLSLYLLLDRPVKNTLLRSMVAGILLGLAILTKGPVALLIVTLVILISMILSKGQLRVYLKQLLIYGVFACLTFGIWYGIETIRNGPWFVTEFIRYQVDLFLKPGAGHTGFPGYHLVVLLLGCFPVSVFALRPLFSRIEKGDNHVSTLSWMKILLIVVLVLFSIVQSKIVHYSSLCYFPITFLASVYLYQLVGQSKSLGSWQKAGLISIAMLYIIGGIALVYFGMHPQLIENLITLDENARASLSVDVNWQWWHVLPVLFLVVAIVSLYIRSSTLKQTVVVYACTAAFIYSGVALWVGKIQQYSQGPATEFYSSLRGKDVYVLPWGHKSYAQYWDFRKPLAAGFTSTNTETTNAFVTRYSDPDFLLTSSEVTKDVYVITKTSKAEEFQNRYPEVKRIGEKGGFVFFVKTLKR